MGDSQRVEPGPGQESVWDYPRPPAALRLQRHIRVRFGGATIVESRRPIKVMETSHPPVYYVPFEDVLDGVLVEGAHHTYCEYKGQASYCRVRVGEREASNAAWFYPDPAPGYELLAGHVAFYPQLMDECTVDGEIVTPQEGRFYGGWITSEIVGPFKGSPATFGW